ncbi:MAG: Nif3-like dinuclear metal center hexameric protein [Cryomorphaceae bacterium]|nr:Nif3-like dinuclear metal center hexameric protein [Cryomorphaceae bacterium]
MTALKDIIRVLENWAPKSLQENYDNVGLQIGNPDVKISRALITLDITVEVLEEAIAEGCNLIIAHHPLIFRPLKKITGSNLVERCVEMAIKNDIALYAIHTNLDNVNNGVNKIIADKLQLKNQQILQPGKSVLRKLVVFVPEKDSETVLKAMFDAGAGTIGNYDECSFQLSGNGTFRAGENTNPHVGEKNIRHSEKEIRIEVVVPETNLGSVINAIKKTHPYEEVAYDIYTLENVHPQIGAGMIGELPEAVESVAFIEKIKNTFNCGVVKFTKNGPRQIKRVALCGGSGSFLISTAKAQGADVFISGDITYHSYFDATEKFMIVDIGHYESEQFTSLGIMQFLKEKMPNFATLLTKVNTNPVNTK